MTDEEIIEEPIVTEEPVEETAVTEEPETKEEPVEEVERKKLDPKQLLNTVIGIPKMIYQKMYDWLWGTEEHPHHPFSKRGRFRRWFMIKFRGYQNIIYTHYDRAEDEYVYEKELIHKSKIPRDAVHVTGEPNSWHIDIDLIKRGFSSERDNGFTAVDAFNYMLCNKIDDAMLVRMDKTENMDPQKILTIAALAIGACLAAWYFLSSGTISFS